MSTTRAAGQPAQAGGSAFQRWLDYPGVPVAVGVFLALYLMPTPNGLSVQGQTAIAVFMGALVLCVSQAVPTYATSLPAMILLVPTGAWGESNVRGVFRVLCRTLGVPEPADPVSYARPVHCLPPDAAHPAWRFELG